MRVGRQSERGREGERERGREGERRGEEGRGEVSATKAGQVCAAVGSAFQAADSVLVAIYRNIRHGLTRATPAIDLPYQGLPHPSTSSPSTTDMTPPSRRLLHQCRCRFLCMHEAPGSGVVSRACDVVERRFEMREPSWPLIHLVVLTAYYSLVRTHWRAAPLALPPSCRPLPLPLPLPLPQLSTGLGREPPLRSVQPTTAHLALQWQPPLISSDTSTC